MFNVVAAVDCGRPPTVLNAQSSQTLATSSPAMTTVTYTCNYGYFIGISVLKQTITCHNDGLWSNTPKCTG